ncbi:MAG TPA: hypothetical protein VNO30_14835 [Kofleriaceae bacterium]|nr:hypothetical protein [Kofleriaceae bacterium]
MASPVRALALCILLLAACGGGHSAPGDAGDPPPDPPDAGVDAPVYEATELELDLGHAAAIRSLRRAGDRALSADTTGRWVLWDLPGHRAIARGEICAECPALLAGDTVALRVTGGFELRAAATGSVRATVAMDATNAGLASDGSYVWAATATSLRAWSAQGAQLLDVSGNYAAARVHAAPAELRVALGPAGASTIETLQLAGGGRSTRTFAGAFHSWFDDGERFLTAVGTAVRVYGKDGAQLAFASLSTTASLTGQGSHVWTYDPPFDNDLRIYAASDLSAPVQTYALPQAHLRPMAGRIAIFRTTVTEQLFELVSLGPVVTRSGPIPVSVLDLTAFGGDASGWLIGNGNGVVLDDAAVLGTSADRRSLSLGRVWSTAGAADGTAVIATASGRAPVLSLGPAATIVSHELSLRSTHVELSHDAALLVATDNLQGAQYHEDRSLRVVRVADGTPIYTWPYRWSDYPDLFFDFSFARRGLVLCHLKERYEQVGGWAGQRIYTTVTGTTLPSYGPAFYDGSSPELVDQLPRLSPSGAHAAFRTSASLVGSTTQIYTNGVLAGAVTGNPLLWLDDDRLLVVTFRQESGKVGHQAVQDKVFVYDPSGTQGVEVTLPPLTGPILLPASGVSVSLTPVGGSRIYSRRHNAVLDYATGATVWRGDPSVTDGVVVGDSVLFARGPRLFRASFR